MLRAFILLFATLLAHSASAQVLGGKGAEPFRAQLIGAGPQSDNRQLAGVMISLDPGWKTYWRAPGDGGIAPRFDWSKSSNLRSVAYIWPSPQVFHAYGSVTIGYENEFILPVLMQAIDPSKPIMARLDMDFGVCSDLCMPASTSISAEVFEANEINALTLEGSIAQRAATSREAGLESAVCTISHVAGDDFLFNAELKFKSNRQGEQILVVETGNEDIWISQTDTKVAGRQIRSQADLVNFSGGPMVLAREDLRLTLVGSGRAVDINGCTG